MKKLFLTFTFLSLNCFGETGVLKAPFAEITFEKDLSSAGRLVIPPMVAEASYREAITEDCRIFQETVSKYGAQISAADILALVTEPLPYSMKKTYEAEVVFTPEKSVSLAENGELILHVKSEPLVLEWSEPDLLKDIQNPSASIVRAQASPASGLWLKFTRRDVFCGYMKDVLKLKTESLVYWKLSDRQKKMTEENLNLLFTPLKRVLSLEKGDKLIAALAGRAIHIVTSQPGFQADKRFSSIDYIWNLLFENENSIQKSALWNKPLNGVYLQEKPVAYELKGLQ
jgi:hypothetical protein